MPIRVSVRAVFSKYSLTPARGINFEPLTYNNTSKPRTFEITNLGEFPFDFKLFNFATPPAAPAADAGAAGGKDAGKDKKVGRRVPDVCGSSGLWLLQSGAHKLAPRT